MLGRTLGTVWLLGAPLAAQHASPYLPRADWAAPFAEHFITAGVIPDPSRLDRPFTEAALGRALDRADTAALAPVARRSLATLRARTTPPAGPGVSLAAHLGLSAYSQARRDPLRPAGPGGTRPSGGIAAALTLGRFVLATHPYFDNRLKQDPEWYGFKSRAIAGRQAESYVSGQFGRGELFFGTLDRNWGPTGPQGLLLSDSPYGYDRLAYRVGTAAVELQGTVGQLSRERDSTGAMLDRFLVASRLVIRPAPRWAFSVWQGAVLAGAGRRPDFWYLNPLNIGYVVQVNEDAEGNHAVGLDFDVGLSRRARVFGQVLLDDAQVDRAGTLPLQAAATLGARGGTARGRLAWTAWYTVVTNLAYRHHAGPTSGFLHHDLGLGRNFSDYDQVTVGASWLALPLLLLTPELTLLRQGEGDIRAPFPPPAEWPGTPGLFAGVQERTVRLALGARGVVGTALYLDATAAIHRRANADHVRGRAATQFVGHLAASFEWRRFWPLAVAP
jgi:hypothetical protein